jgi:Holliday junction resolvase-like predicted endonuclease
VGDIGELQVAADLLAKGHDVFKSICRNCWTDLIVRIDGKLLSVEVKTGHRAPSGKLTYPKPREKSDVIAVVLPSEIVYLPPLF